MVSDMSNLNIFKVLSKPSTSAIVADSVYFVKSSNSDHFEVFVSNKEGNKLYDLRGTVPNQNVPQGFGTSVIVSTYSDLNNIDTDESWFSFVVDATGDTTVSSGGAFYAYDSVDLVWIKVAETESMDVILSWDNIQGKPNSTPTQIDTAVNKVHEHGNKAVLDLLTVSGGKLQYDGNDVSISNAQWNETEW